MNSMVSLISRGLSNKHTSLAAVVYFIAKAIAQFGPIWFPSHAQQFKDSLPLVEGLAVSYGLLMAGDASQSAAAKTTADTAAKPIAPPVSVPPQTNP